jgi:hypothetical protein
MLISGKILGRHLDSGSDAEKQDQRRHDIEGVRVFQRKTNDSQATPPITFRPSSNWDPLP